MANNILKVLWHSSEPIVIDSCQALSLWIIQHLWLEIYQQSTNGLMNLTSGGY